MLKERNLTGGLSSVIAGGNFWDGARQGVITAGLNHAMHEIFPLNDPPGEKGKKSTGEKAKEYLENVVTAAEMTLDWALGTGADNTTFKNDAVANSFRDSQGINNARNDYYSKGKTSGHYNFGLKGLINAGIDPIEQFVGSYSYKISSYGNKLIYTVTNTTSFASFAYHLWPYSWNWSNGPMGNNNQTYIFSEPIRTRK